jgi:arginyl-tRNA synthetase
MHGKDVSKKIEELLIVSSEIYFHQNLPDVIFPKDIGDTLQLTRDPRHGDMTSNIAMRLASAAKRSPKEVGLGILSVLKKRIAETGLSLYVGEVEIAGGFLNFRLSEEYFRKLLVSIHEQGADFGRSDEGNGKRINIEFVSANPTGPLTIAHGRQAAIGDALARILRFDGYDVTCEYYLNDMGRQINMLGESVAVRYRNLFGRNDPMPEDGYMGDYIVDMARKVKDMKLDGLLSDSDADRAFFRNYAVDYMMKLIKEDLRDFGVEFDVWTPQSRIEGDKEVEKTLDELEKNTYIYESEGARWFSSTRFGDDKDRVVVKSDGSFTYLAPDIAYHRDKYRRKYSRLIDLLGPDHHGYIKRMKAAVQALGHDQDSLDILIVQLVTLMRAGESVSMSTRKGDFISLREIMDEIGKDVTRFFFLSRRLDSHLDLDIELAKKESADNPVFYMQYAHARIRSIQKFSSRNRFRFLFRKTDLKVLDTEQEKQLMRKLGEFPFVVRSSAEALEPNRLLSYLNELARSFHSFYTKCRVVSDDTSVSKARLFLVESTRIVLANGLGLLNITLPESM